MTLSLGQYGGFVQKIFKNYEHQNIVFNSIIKNSNYGLSNCPFFGKSRLEKQIMLEVVTNEKSCSQSQKLLKSCQGQSVNA